MEETHDLMEASTTSRNLNPLLNDSTVKQKESNKKHYKCISLHNLNVSSYIHHTPISQQM